MPFHPENLGASGYADAHKVYVPVLDRSTSPHYITPSSREKKRHINALLASYELSPYATTIALAGGNILEVFEGGGVGSRFREKTNLVDGHIGKNSTEAK
ncbi:hypothetical protein BU17DRAFT_103883 [Hysterangium stoloniferum]|nr:hypothetical protein BU17DRAFT_103883 [Hysterangium stoloniferum]